MHPDDVRVGETYRVRISRRDNPARMLTTDPDDAEAALSMFALTISSEVDVDVSFDLTVTATGRTLDGEPAVTGVRVAESSHVCTPLSPEVAQRLGLPTSVGYIVEGVLKDASTGEAVNLPQGQSITVPVRWLTR